MNTDLMTWLTVMWLVTLFVVWLTFAPRRTFTERMEDRYLTAKNVLTVFGKIIDFWTALNPDVKNMEEERERRKAAQANQPDAN